MKPPFAVLRQHYPASEKREDLYPELGWADLVSKPAFEDTCAVRVSIALLRSGVAIPGAWLRINNGPLKDKMVQPRQGDLSRTIVRMWGKPEKFKGTIQAHDIIGNRTGVISFFRVYGAATDGGHIDLVWPAGNGFHKCARSCFFTAAELWFWELK